MTRLLTKLSKIDLGSKGSFKKVLFGGRTFSCRTFFVFPYFCYRYEHFVLKTVILYFQSSTLRVFEEAQIILNAFTF